MTKKLIIPKLPLHRPNRVLFVPRAKPLHWQRGYMRMPVGVGMWSKDHLSIWAVDLDGTNDYLTRSAFSSASASKTGVISLWRKFDALANYPFWVGSSGTDSFELIVFGTGAVQITAYDGGGNTIFQLLSTSGAVGTSVWHHILMAWDVGANVFQVYVDGVDKHSFSTRVTDTTYPWNSATPVRVSGDASATLKTNGGAAEDWLSTDTYVDISSASNREKWRESTTGGPAYLGERGELPLAAVPTMYLTYRPNAGRGGIDAYAKNRGYGGDFSIVGALTRFASAPTP